jgi:osmotically-inducible protein OsmY
MIVSSAAFVLAMPAGAQEVTDTTEKMSDPALAPIAQGNSKIDLKMTAKIRKEIMAANNMSVSAQNIEIVTNATKVTLRGSVDTAKDKRLIGEIAERHSPPGHVDNQLEVKVVAD